MIDPRAAVSALESAGFSHLVWIPDSHLGTWEPALASSRLAPIRVCREGEAVGLAAGLMLGGAKPVVAVQCTGFFEAGDAVRNVAHDLKLPLKLIVGVRGFAAVLAGKGKDNCPHFAEKVMNAWELPWGWFHPDRAEAAELQAAMRDLAAFDGASAILWTE